MTIGFANPYSTWNCICNLQIVLLLILYKRDAKFINVTFKVIIRKQSGKKWKMMTSQFTKHNIEKIEQHEPHHNKQGWSSCFTYDTRFVAHAIYVVFILTKLTYNSKNCIGNSFESFMTTWTIRLHVEF